MHKLRRSIIESEKWGKYVLQKCEKCPSFAFRNNRSKAISEESHNGIAAVLKTAGLPPVGVRVPLPPQPCLNRFIQPITTLCNYRFFYIDMSEFILEEY
ncbi:MAG: hypothetical protein RLZZ578_311 [Bacteroidota bacterium]|jgi:hypothetical protein